MNLNEEIDRIKYLMFESTFSGSEKVIVNLLEKKLESMNGYLLFDRFFDGESDIINFKNNFINSVKRGELGKNLGEVSQNMKYLNNTPMILGVLESIFKKGEKNITKALGYTFNEKKYDILTGAWCKGCEKQSDVKEEVLKDVAKYQSVVGSIGDQEDLIKQTAFYLYGKDAGRLLPNLSLKYKDIKTLFGLVGRGGLDKRLDKRAEKLGISRYELEKFNRNKQQDKGFDNLPPFTLLFNKRVYFKDNKTYFQIDKGDKLLFNWDDEQKVFRHKTSSKKYTNATEIQINMTKTPKTGETYDNVKIVKLIPSGGAKFELTPNIPVNFTIESQK